MKKSLAIFLMLVMVISVLSSCGQKKEDKTEINSEAISIVTTIFPGYDWVRNIVGEVPQNIEIKMLLDDGVDLHSYQPTAEDIQLVSECDMFVYTGGESDEWVDKVLEQATNKDMVVVNMMDALGDSVKEEETIEGMQKEEEHEHEEGEAEKDEHIWLSLKNAQKLIWALEEGLEGVDPENAQIYRDNTTAYEKTLNELDQEYQKSIEKRGKDTILFADRFPFRYMVDDYGLKYYAAFVGCSAETEASFETIKFLAEKIDELNLSSVAVIDGSDEKIARSVIENSKKKDAEILAMNSMQSITAANVNDGANYVEIMKDNLGVLEKLIK